MEQARKKTVLVLDSNTLGRGDDGLGATLIVNFLRNVGFQDDVPDTILCYNSGAALAENSSPALPMLQVLADKGSDIIICATCVDFFKLEGKLGVGHVGDMRGIVDALMAADKIIYV